MPSFPCLADPGRCLPFGSGAMQCHAVHNMIAKPTVAPAETGAAVCPRWAPSALPRPAPHRLLAGLSGLEITERRPRRCTLCSAFTCHSESDASYLAPRLLAITADPHPRGTCRLRNGQQSCRTVAWRGSTCRRGRGGASGQALSVGPTFQAQHGAVPHPAVVPLLRQASEEFRELCAVQLELLTSLLQRSSGAPVPHPAPLHVFPPLCHISRHKRSYPLRLSSSLIPCFHRPSCVHGAGDGSKINSSVFARQPESFETGALRLQRVAAWGPDAACSVGACQCRVGTAGNILCVQLSALCAKPHTHQRRSATDGVPSFAVLTVL